MQNIWATIKDYYITLGKNYYLNPIIFLSIHIVATPLFVLSAAWLIKNYRRKKSIVWPVIVSLFIFNAANIYLVVLGRNIPWYIYAILAGTTFLSGYFSFKKIQKKMKTL